MRKTYTQYFENVYGDGPRSKVGYVRAHHDVFGYTPLGNEMNQNIISRYRNMLVNAINEHIIMPKAIVINLENLLQSLNHFEPGVSTLVGRALEWIANQYHRIVIAHKEKLPTKSRRFRYPIFLWTQLPRHYNWSQKQNEFREKVNTCIANTTSLFREMETLAVEWDDCNRSYTTKGDLNAAGLTAYWHAVDEAVEKWDRSQLQLKNGTSGGKQVQLKSTIFKKGKRVNMNHYCEDVSHTTKYRWNPEESRFKLPKPK